MIRTFNRQPLSVNTPDKKDIKQYFFNHYNWKGIINNKNFLGVDQESFEECNNVYVSTDGLLHSRPSLKKEQIVVYSQTTPTSQLTQHLSNIVDIWQFEDITVYRSEDDYLTFVQDNKGIQTLLTFNIIITKHSTCKYKYFSICHYKFNTSYVIIDIKS